MVFPCLLLLGPLSANASEKALPLCSLYYAPKLKSAVTSLNKIDKFNHCALSCQLGLRCGSLDSFGIGVLKEIYDLFTPGDADIEDLKADLKGISFYRSKRATNDNECVDLCDYAYPTN